MTAPVERKKLKSELRREAIMQNALRIFDRRGFSNTSLDDIAKATGVKREAIYYYFNNRAEILLHIIRPQSKALVEALKEIVQSDASARDKLYRAICNHLERFDRNCLEMTVSLRDIYLEGAADVRREMDKIWRAYETLWVRLIDEGQASGEFARFGDSKMVAFGILGMCNWLARWYDPTKAIGISELVETYFNMIAHGLVAGSRDKGAKPADAAARVKSVPKAAPRASRRRTNGR